LKQIGKSLARARLARRDTQEIAGQRCGVHAQTIARIERGDPRVAIGTVFAMMTLYGRNDALLALAEDDDATVSLAQQTLPKRGSTG
jgi:transcriptional regulator with XRE-family HTH domain